MYMQKHIETNNSNLPPIVHARKYDNGFGLTPTLELFYNT
jgi:hypothetical protein